MSRQTKSPIFTSRETICPNPASRIAYRLVALAIFLVSSTAFAAPKFTVIQNFNFTDGAYPGPLIADNAGNLFGTGFTGGSSQRGVVFELSPPAQPGGSWIETVLYNFTGGSDGNGPNGELAMDAHGNLYGTAYETSNGYGNVFELAKNSDGTYTFSVLYAFTGGTDGGLPGYGVIVDASGNLFGETGGGGNTGCPPFGCGVVFEVSPSSTGWTEQVLYAFQSTGPHAPTNPIVLRNGNLYGTTGLGSGTLGTDGAVYELSLSGGTWNYTQLYGFQGSSDGSQPGPISFDNLGNLFGTTPDGGTSSYGTVFELTPSSGTGLWNKTVLHSFAGGTDGNLPMQVVPGANGKLYGVTYYGGNVPLCPLYAGCGAVFKLTNEAGTWTNSILSINGSQVFRPLGLTLVGKKIFGPIFKKPNVDQWGAVYEVTGFN